MITQTDIESIHRYRSRLGEELYQHLLELWQESEQVQEQAQEQDKEQVQQQDEGQAGDQVQAPSLSESALPENTVLDNGDCPVCGHAAEIGILLDLADEKEGSPRKLWCSYCENLWDFDRIRCTRCGTRTQESLSYHFNEGDRARRIYYCSECEGTQKVINEKGLENPQHLDLRLESILMVDLEQVVQNHCADKSGSNFGLSVRDGKEAVREQ
jgi:FdhE protein